MLKALDIWLGPYLFRDRPPKVEGCTHLIVAVCDHFEPFHEAGKGEALRRVGRWAERFPKIVSRFSGGDGVGPRHSFFYPIEQYDPEVVEGIAEICRETGSEVEVHLHHDEDTGEGLRAALGGGIANYARHGLGSRDAEGRPVFGFIHGNWALDNSDPAGENCGVSNELGILREAGCYADFTMPSAPSPTQTRIINALYYAASGSAPKSHDTGVRVAAGPASTSPSRTGEGNLLLVQGPLGLNWRRRKWGVLPRIENGDLTWVNPPTRDRLELWLRLGIHVAGRPDWRFIKLHTHGAIEPNMGMLLGEPMERFHELLASEYNDGERFAVHYVTAREMVNILHAAEEGAGGDPGEHRDRHYRRR